MWLGGGAARARAVGTRPDCPRGVGRGGARRPPRGLAGREGAGRGGRGTLPLAPGTPPEESGPVRAPAGASVSKSPSSLPRGPPPGPPDSCGPGAVSWRWVGERGWARLRLPQPLLVFLLEPPSFHPELRPAGRPGRALCDSFRLVMRRGCLQRRGSWHPLLWG